MMMAAFAYEDPPIGAFAKRSTASYNYNYAERKPGGCSGTLSTPLDTPLTHMYRTVSSSGNEGLPEGEV